MQIENIEEFMKDRVAEALFDFMGFITTHEEEIVVGSGKTVYGILDAFNEWCLKRGFEYNTNIDPRKWEGLIKKENLLIIKVKE